MDPTTPPAAPGGAADADEVPCELCDVGPLRDPTVVVRSRRRTLRDLAVLGGAAVGAPFLLPGVALGAPADAGRRRTLVCVFLRGGLDGLATLAPLEDADLATARPDLVVDDLVDLDGRFGLHPAAAALADLHTDGRLALVHGVGTAEPIRSHFGAQAHVESAGAPGTEGWLARLLGARGAVSSPLAALAIGPRLPHGLAGDPGALALTDVATRGVGLPPGVPDGRDLLRELTAAQPTVAGPAATTALDAVEALAASGVADVAPGEGYPASGLGQGLAQVARMLRAEVPLEVACVDAGGFDLHADLTARQGELLDDLARSLAAFAADLDDRLDDVLVLAVSEFGRRVHQNGTGGTDHGRGGLALLLGGGVVGGVHGTWPGTDPDALERPRAGDPTGDLAVTTDVRDVLADAVVATTAPADPPLGQVLAATLPAHAHRPTGAVEATASG